MVSRTLGVGEVGGSNPPVPTKFGGSMETTVRNDGKKKHHSWEAHAEIGCFLLPDGSCSGTLLVGYGANEAEARENLVKAIGALKSRIAQ